MVLCKRERELASTSTNDNKNLLERKWLFIQHIFMVEFHNYHKTIFLAIYLLLLKSENFLKQPLNSSLDDLLVSHTRFLLHAPYSVGWKIEWMRWLCRNRHSVSTMERKNIFTTSEKKLHRKWNKNIAKLYNFLCCEQSFLSHLQFNFSFFF